MEVNWIIIGIVAASAMGLVIYLVKQNQKDQQKVTEHFNTNPTEISEDEELNNER